MEAIKMTAMKKLIFNLTLILGFSLFTGGCYDNDWGDFGWQKTPDEHYTLNGIVTDNETGVGVSGIEVGVKWSVSGDITAQVTYDSTFVKTDSAGKFSLSYFGPQAYQLIVNAPGYKGYSCLGGYYDIATQPHFQGRSYFEIKLYKD